MGIAHLGKNPYVQQQICQAVDRAFPKRKSPIGFSTGCDFGEEC
jgi:hypothetical protein